MIKRACLQKLSVGLLVVALLVATGMFITPATGWAQVTTANYYGIVTDPTGALIPGATVTLTHEGTGASTTRTADAGGEFVFDFLRVGFYTLRIEAPGFKVYQSSGIELAAAQNVRRTFALELGEVTETVQVEGSAPLVNTVSAEQRESVSTMEVSQLPLARRNYTNLLTLGTGVTVSASGGGPGHGNRDGGVRLNGLGRSATTFTIDGTDANANSEGRAGALFTNFNYIDMMSIEAVQEVQVVKGIIPAEYGQALSGNVNLITKSGTNEWHGSLFENFQAENLNARHQFLTQKAPSTFNQFGGSLGGPIRRNRVFIFTTYEGYRESTAQLVNGNTPTQKFRDEMISAVPAYQEVLDPMPLPNEPHAADADIGFYQTVKSSRARDNHLVAKGDLRLTDTSNLALTYTRGRPFRIEPKFQIDNSGLFHGYQERGTASFVTGGAAWTSETRFGYNLQDLDTIDAFFLLGIPEETMFGGRRPRLDTPWFNTGDNQLWLQEGPVWSLEQKYARHAGKHSFKFGGGFVARTGGRVKVTSPAVQYLNKQELLANTPSLVNVTFGSPLYNGDSYEWGVFAQDDWRVDPKLVLNLGVRYDFYSKMVARGRDPKEPAGFYNLDGLLDDQFHFGPFRDPENPYESDGFVNLGPRFGFSYNPDGLGKNVIRGGFSVLFSPLMQGMQKMAVGSKLFPFRVLFSKQEIAVNGMKFPVYNDQAKRIIVAESERTGQFQVFAVFNPQIQNPYSMNLYLGLQRTLTPSLMLETALVGNRGVKFIMNRYFNTVDRLTGVRPNPEMGQGYYVDNTQNSFYASWQTSLRKRFSKGLVGSVHYTWGKALSTQGGDIGSYYNGDSTYMTQDFFNPRSDRGPSAGDVTHYFAYEAVYELPRFANVSSPMARHVLGGWQVSSMMVATTGEPVTVTMTCAHPHCRPDYAGGAPVFGGYRETLQYLDKSAFAPVPLVSASGTTLRPGNIGAGAIRGPGRWNVDASLGKNFRVTERVQLQFRADAFNFFNHTNYRGFSSSINSVRFGKFTETYGARVVQLNMRLTF